MAVYGTLKKGYHNYDRFIAPLEPLWKGEIYAPLLMITNGMYPMLLPSDTHHPLWVEVYEMSDQLAELIRLLEEPYGLKLQEIKIGPFLANIWVHKDYNIPIGFEIVSDGNFSATKAWQEN